jgi:hypothetical protein
MVAGRAGQFRMNEALSVLACRERITRSGHPVAAPPNASQETGEAVRLAPNSYRQAHN